MKASMKKRILIFALFSAWTASALAQDDYFKFAQKAYENKDYELCLISLKGSPLAGEGQGLELEKLCRAGDVAAAVSTSTSTTPLEPAALVTAKPYSLFAKGRVGKSDNINQAASPVEKSNFALGVGGEYTLKKVVEFGLGASYDYFEVFDTKNSAGTVFSVFAPLGFVSGPHQFSMNAFYNTNTADETTIYNERGVSVGYYLRIKNFLFNIANTYSERQHQAEVQAYQTGLYNSLQFNVIGNFDKLALGLGVNSDRNESGDMPFGTMRILPLRHEARGYTLTAAYNFNDTSKLTARYKKADLDFNNIGGNYFIKRKDNIQNTSLTYLHVFNPLVTAFAQVSRTNNSSTFDKAELLDKNYSENLASVGFTVYSE